MQEEAMNWIGLFYFFVGVGFGVIWRDAWHRRRILKRTNDALEAAHAKAMAEMGFREEEKPCVQTKPV